MDCRREAAFSPPESGGQRGTKCRARGGFRSNTPRYGVGTTPRTIATSSRSCCPPDSGGLKLLRSGYKLWH